MKTQPITITSNFVAALRACRAFRKQALAQDPYVDNGADHLLMDKALLAVLVNTCFWATLEREEGRGPRGSVCIAAPAEAPNSRAFDRPMALTLRNLVTLLTASPGCPVAVQKVKGKAVIWGLLDIAPSLRPSIRLVDTGKVTATVDVVLLALLHSGVVQIPKTQPGGALHAVTYLLTGKNETQESLTRTSTLFRVANHIQAHRHGGALAVIPAGSRAARSVDVPIRFNVASSKVIQDRLRAWQTAGQGLSGSGDGSSAHDPEIQAAKLLATGRHQSFVDSLLTAVGNLSAVDGAVLMDDRLRLLGFGAKLRGHSSRFRVSQWDILRDHVVQTWVDDLGGMRHQSAARFVRANPDAFVFVASQDGGLTLFCYAANPSRVLVVRSLELFLFS